MATGHRQTTPLIIKALQMAVSRLSKDDNVILHSDKGSKYSFYDYKKFAKKHNIILSMSRNSYLDYISPNEFENSYNEESLKK